MWIRSRTPGKDGAGDEDGYRQLSAAVLHQALRDWWAASAGRPTVQQREVAAVTGYGQNCVGELRDFFESDWLDYLCLAVGVDLNAYLAAARRGPGLDD